MAEHTVQNGSGSRPQRARAGICEPSAPRGRTRVVHFEQAVYGSFSFWDRGYGILAQSPGCRQEWIAELRAACQRFGEPPGGFAGPECLFALRLPSGPWAIVGVSAPSIDEKGRPGALAFHAIFVTKREFRKVGYNPFALAHALRRAWHSANVSLASGSYAAEGDERARSSDDLREAERIGAAIEARRRVAIESSEPIESLARAVWARLSVGARRRASVATFAYSAAIRFDLLALPRLAGTTLDKSYINPETDSSARLAYREQGNKHWRRRVAIATACLVLASVSCLALWPQIRGVVRKVPQATASTVDQAPDRSAYRAEPLDPDQRARVLEGLVDLAQRFGVLEPDGVASGANPDPAQVMTAISQRLRYRGPLLSAQDLEQLKPPAGERESATRWHAHVLLFLPDRPLPADFARGPLRWQLDTLVWSFHLKPDPRQSDAEVPLALAAALAVDGPVRPQPRTRDDPALEHYAHFLARLPRR
jgi:hypothetical protein